MRRSIQAALLVLACTASAHAAPKKKADLPWLHERIGRTWMLLAPIDLMLDGGYAFGWYHRHDSGGLVEGSLALEPQLRWRRGRFRLLMPLSVSHRTTVGFHLPATRLAGGLGVRWRASDTVTLGWRGDVWHLMRPDWPDLYQPVLDERSEPTGELLGTERYGATRLGAAVSCGWALSEHLSLGLDLALDTQESVRDPHFDPVLAPTHLVPGSRDHWRLAAALRAEPIDKRLHTDLTVTVEGWTYAFAFARDAQTGETHTSLGGKPANPLQPVVRTTLRPKASLWLPALKTRLSLDLELAHNEDRYAGYYTWDAIGLDLAVRVRPLTALRFELGYGLELRRYTHRGYQPGETHPPLDDGHDVRTRVRHELQAELVYALWDGRLEPFVSARWMRVDDAMPDYVPYVNPVFSPYAVDFDANWAALRIGLRLGL